MRLKEAKIDRNLVDKRTGNLSLCSPQKEFNLYKNSVILLLKKKNFGLVRRGLSNGEGGRTLRLLHIGAINAGEGWNFY